MTTSKRWRGRIPAMPQQPDIVLARHLEWTRPKGTALSSTALAAYPEPDNITAAAAFAKLDIKDVPATALIYKDPTTDLWIVAMGYRQVNLDQIQAWLDQQYELGACALWYNVRAIPPRRQRTLSEREVSVQNQDKITYVERLLAQGHKQLTVPEAEPVDTTRTGAKIEIEYATRKPKDDFVSQDKKYTRAKSYVDADYKIRAEHLRCMPVMTPNGAFNSVTEAAMAIMRSPSYVSVRVATRQPGWYKLSRAEYEQILQSA